MKLGKISLLIFVFFKFLFYLNPSWASCVVKQDDGGIYKDISVASCAAYYPSGHACHLPNLTRPQSCARIDMFLAVDWGRADLINNAHRGIWGLEMHPNVATDSNVSKLPINIKGSPENSLPGIDAAFQAGWYSIEYDIILVRDDSSPATPKTVGLGHYLDLARFADFPVADEVIKKTGKAGPNDGFLMGTTRVFNQDSDYYNYYLKDRDSFQTDLVGYASFYKFLHYVYISEMAVVLDPKWVKELQQFRRRPSDGKLKNTCIGFCGGYPSSGVADEAMDLLYEAVQTAKTFPLGNQLNRLIFKLPQDAYPDIDAIKTRLGSDFYGVLFAPQPDAGGKKPMADVLNYIDSWINENDGRHVAFWDTAIKSYTHWMGKPFTWKGTDYDDLTDYLKRRSGKRAAIWAQDLSGPGGRHGNYFMSYTNYASSKDDLRGDLFANLYLKYSKNAVITTDRPDLFLQMKAHLDTLFP